jgi:hypothetical protein
MASAARSAAAARNRPSFGAPFFAGAKAAVHEALVPAQLLPVVELVEKGPPKGQEHAALFPLPQPTPARRGAAVPRWQFAPRGARPQDPQDAFETPAGVGPGPASARLALLTRQMLRRHDRLERAEEVEARRGVGGREPMPWRAVRRAGAAPLGLRGARRLLAADHASGPARYGPVGREPYGFVNELSVMVWLPPTSIASTSRS